VTPGVQAIPRRVSRRQALWLAGGAAGILLTGCGDDAPKEDSSPTRPAGLPRTPAQGAGSLIQPPVVSSLNGVLETTLTVEPAMVPYGTGSRWALAVNGITPGPTLRVRPGDRLRLRLENRMAHATNLHTHGLHVSPSGNADNPFLQVGPGERFTYDIPIPVDHPGGLFWYHPHLHHSVAEQLFSGFFGAIVVEDAFDRSPEVAAANERLLLIHDARIGATEAAVTSVSGMEQMIGREGSVVLVNGVPGAEIKVSAGTLERWRILNASPSRFYRLELAGHQLQLIGTDGGRLARSVSTGAVLMVPGERLELMVQPTVAGTYALSTRAVDRGRAGMGMGTGPAATSAAAEVLKLVVSGTSAGPAPLPALPAPAAALTQDAVTTKREVVFSMQGMSFFIDAKSFDAERIDIRAKLGTVEEWTIRNTSTMDHPFHLHVWPFQVAGQSPGTPPVGWKDVVNVPAGGSVRLLVRFADFKGKSVFHCHILDHEDLGMMGTIEVA
jgi:FtsP/CotA-like multicopper oxidase with cupredoxin domain